MAVTLQEIKKLLEAQSKLDRDHLEKRLSQEFSSLDKRWIGKIDNLEERFEERLVDQIDSLETRLSQKLDEKLDEKLGKQTLELKQYVHEAFEVQQEYIDERFKELLKGIRFQAILPNLKRR